jgi:hypothetical protein
LGAAFSVALIFYALSESFWVSLFLFLDEGISSIDCISWLMSYICTRICCMV